MNFIRRRDKEFRSHSQSHYSMSTKTRDFLQKICYKKTASVDMTQYGFINESKVKPVNLLLRPLRQQLEKICGSFLIIRYLIPFRYHQSADTNLRLQ